MCRGKNICSELGVNPEKWDKFSPLRNLHQLKDWKFKQNCKK
jgi:hypothetical protein